MVINNRKGAIHRTEIERSFLVTEGFNTNLVQFLPPYYDISNVGLMAKSLGFLWVPPSKFC